MKIFKTICFLSLVLNYNISYSQDLKMNKEVEEIIALGKDSIIQLALELMDDNVEIQNFSKIRVMTNGKTVYVSFLNPIKYLPMNSVFYSDFGVDLIKKVVSHGSISNGNVDTVQEIPLYNETKEAKKNIQFVIDAINKSEETGSIDPTTFEDNMEIREYETYFSIQVVSEYQESSYKIEKKSGKIDDAQHAHIEPKPLFEDENNPIFIEIN